MNNIFKRYSLPWKIHNAFRPGYYYLRDADNKPILTCEDIELLEYIAENANNRMLPRITDADASCDCGWLGSVGDCIPDIDGDGSLGCPRCQAIIEVIA